MDRLARCAAKPQASLPTWQTCIIKFRLLLYLGRVLDQSSLDTCLNKSNRDLGLFHGPFPALLWQPWTAGIFVSFLLVQPPLLRNLPTQRPIRRRGSCGYPRIAGLRGTLLCLRICSSAVLSCVAECLWDLLRSANAANRTLLRPRIPVPSAHIRLTVPP